METELLLMSVQEPVTGPYSGARLYQHTSSHLQTAARLVHTTTSYLISLTESINKTCLQTFINYFCYKISLIKRVKPLYRDVQAVTTCATVYCIYKCSFLPHCKKIPI